QDIMSLNNKNLMDDSKDLSSLTYRIYTGNIAWKIFLKNPIFGTGIGDYYFDKEIYIDQGELRDDFRHTLDAHNEYLEALSTLGLVGLLLLLAIYSSALWSRPNVYILLIVISFMIFGLTTPVLKNKWGLLTFLFLINHFGLHYEEQASNTD
ncbi:O-antigen ligase family protein, partial [bacterium]|nr:O-antigen ligase family protein [bacterium]